MITAHLPIDGMLDFALAEESRGNGFQLSNRGPSYHSGFDVLHRLPGAGELGKAVALACSEMGESRPMNAWAWVSLLRDGGSNYMHDHPGADWAACLHLTEGSDLVFASGKRIAPHPGRLTVFRGSEPHKVEVHRLGCPRVSIALSVYTGTAGIGLGPAYPIGGAHD